MRLDDIIPGVNGRTAAQHRALPSKVHTPCVDSAPGRELEHGLNITVGACAREPCRAALYGAAWTAPAPAGGIWSQRAAPELPWASAYLSSRSHLAQRAAVVLELSVAPLAQHPWEPRRYVPTTSHAQLQRANTHVHGGTEASPEHAPVRVLGGGSSPASSTSTCVSSQQCSSRLTARAHPAGPLPTIRCRIAARSCVPAVCLTGPRCLASWAEICQRPDPQMKERRRHWRKASYLGAARAPPGRWPVSSRISTDDVF
jgi:hypothetical protein